MSDNDIIVGLDIGTTKVCAIVGERNAKNQVDILGVGTSPSDGLRYGMVINVNQTMESIKAAIEEAEIMAGCDIHQVYIGIAGGHIKGFNSHGMVMIKDGEVSQEDVNRVMDLAVAVGMPPERQIFHTIPQEFMIDQQTGIKDPLGLRGNRLSAKAHIVTGQVTSTENMVNCANNCGLSVADIILQPLASAEAVLSEDEKDLGVALVDIGGGTTDIAIFYCGSIQHTAVITKGGNDITQEISISLRTSTAEAEKIKRQYGCALTDLVIKDEFLDVPTVGKQKLVKCSRKYLAEIIQPSLEEIFNAVHEQILNSGFADLLTSGVVITGGSTMLEGMPQLSEKVLELQTRRGIPNKVDGLSDLVSYPIYSTGVGLVQYGLYNHSAYPPIPLGRPVTETIINRLKSFISSWGIFGHK